MVSVYLGLGSNLGDKERNLSDAIYRIEKRIGRVVSSSAFYETAPWGFDSPNSFLNAAVCVETLLTCADVLAETQLIEKELGRTAKSATATYEDRLVDIDILLYGDYCIREEGLQIPHPLMAERRFVLEPLSEIAPEVLHPVLKKSIKELFAQIK